jgi:superfamily II DNA or RNA helicase
VPNDHLSHLEQLNNFTCYPGQRDFILRLAQHQSGLVAADCGAGKTLIAITLAQLLGAKRIWVIAPKGTVVGDEAQAQWAAEIARFSKLPSHELLTHADHQRIASTHGGWLPSGFYLTHHEAAFVNGGVECPPKGWDDTDLSARIERWHVVDGALATVGRERHGIRCVYQPCLATLIGHHFDMVVVDECHKIGPDTISHQMLHRLQPRHRWAFSATPMIDKPEDVLPILDWVDPQPPRRTPFVWWDGVRFRKDTD